MLSSCIIGDIPEIFSSLKCQEVFWGHALIFILDSHMRMFITTKHMADKSGIVQAFQYRQSLPGDKCRLRYHVKP